MRLTIEWRRRDQDEGNGSTWSGAVDRANDEPCLAIDFLDGVGRALIYPDEVFTADEAGEIFVHYFHTLTVLDRYSLRERNPVTP